MNTKNLLEQIQQKTVAANDDLKDATNNTRPMREGNKRAAKEQLVALKDQFRNVLVQTASYLIAVGPQASELATAAENSPSALVVNPEDFYNEILNKVDERAYTNKLIDGSFANAIGNSLEEVVLQMGVRSYPQLIFKTEYSQMTSNKEQVLAVTKLMINKEIGSDLVGIYAANKVLDEVIKRNPSRFIPIILHTSDESLALSLSKDLKNLSPNVFLVTVGKVSKTLKNVPNSISLKEANAEALEQLLEAVKAKTL